MDGQPEEGWPPVPGMQWIVSVCDDFRHAAGTGGNA
jgi:hypothetical protein